MDTWEDVKDLEVGQEVRVGTKANGFVHGFIREKDEDAQTITIINAAGEDIVVSFDSKED